MRKFYVLILLIAIIGGLSRVFAQNIQTAYPMRNHIETLPLAGNQPEIFSPFEKQKTFSFPYTKNFSPVNKKTLVELDDSIYRWSWDTLTTNWANNPYYKIIDIVYDANNNESGEIGQEWNGTAWVISDQITYAYNANNKMTGELYQTWNGSAWVNLQLTTNTYDARNNHTGFLWQNWNGTGWVNNERDTFEYDAKNNQTTYIEQNWKNNAWVNNFEYSYTYNANNKLSIEFYESWNGAAWANSYKITYKYDSNNNRISGLKLSWSDSTWSWVNSDQYTYTYDSNNNLTCELGQSWNVIGWMNSSRYVYSYSANNLFEGVLNQIWKVIDWVNAYQSSTFYDSNNLFKSAAYKYWNTAGTKITHGDSSYNYYHTITGINNYLPKKQNINFYPNPASDILTLNTVNPGNDNVRLNIYTEMGILVKSEMLKHNRQQLNIGDLSNGIYIIEIKSKEFTETQKLIIQR